MVTLEKRNTPGADGEKYTYRKVNKYDLTVVYIILCCHAISGSVAVSRFTLYSYIINVIMYVTAIFESGWLWLGILV